MSSIALLIAYIGCLSSGSMLSMLLLLVAAYISAAVWLISHGALYTGILYVLVYVGAIVVLIMFVVQLTNTNLSEGSASRQGSKLLMVIQNGVLLTALVIGMLSAYAVYSSSLLIAMSSLSFTYDTEAPSLAPSLASDYEHSLYYSNSLYSLASSIFNEYGYVLVLSVHAIVLAVIGPIKLAISDLRQ